MKNYQAPNAIKTSFTCSHCNVLAQQTKTLFSETGDSASSYYFSDMLNEKQHLISMQCTDCSKIHLFIAGYAHFKMNYKLIYPLTSTAPSAMEDMPPKVLKIYDEARNVLPHSPR